MKCVISINICLVFALKQINENKLQDQLLTHLLLSLFSFLCSPLYSHSLHLLRRLGRFGKISSGFSIRVSLSRASSSLSHMYHSVSVNCKQILQYKSSYTIILCSLVVHMYMYVSAARTSKIFGRSMEICI